MFFKVQSISRLLQHSCDLIQPRWYFGEINFSSKVIVEKNIFLTTLQPNKKSCIFFFFYQIFGTNICVHPSVRLKQDGLKSSGWGLISKILKLKELQTKNLKVLFWYLCDFFCLLEFLFFIMKTLFYFFR